MSQSKGSNKVLLGDFHISSLPCFHEVNDVGFHINLKKSGAGEPEMLETVFFLKF